MPDREPGWLFRMNEAKVEDIARRAGEQFAADIMAAARPAPAADDEARRQKRQAHLAYLYLNIVDCPRCHLPKADGYVCPCGYDL
jgi:hypothetical protein